MLNRMIIYADITFINNFLMTFAILWALAKIMELEYSIVKLSIAAFIATIYLFIVLLIQVFNIYSPINVLLHIVLNLTAAFIIIKISFSDLNKKEALKVIIYFYLITFITIGTSISIFYLIGSTPYRPRIHLLILAFSTVFILANCAWSLFQRYKKVDQYFLPIKIYFKQRTVELIGLVDTGNSLSDPISGRPVVIVNLEKLYPLFPELVDK
ncbi:MAG: sigma-E processing peptidase SpoIIGA, partial [bacterium]